MARNIYTLFSPFREIYTPRNIYTLFSPFPQPLEAGALQRFLAQPPALVAGFVCSALSLGAYDKIPLD